MSAENPAVPLSSIADGDELFDTLAGGDRSASGVRVNRRKALGVSAVWRSVNLIAGDVGRYPLRVYRTTATGREVDRAHPANRLLAPRRKPCPEMGTFVFRQTIQAHALLSGNGYALIERDPLTAKPVGLTPLDPDNTWPVRANGVLYYVVRVPRADGKAGTEWRRLLATDVLHIRGLSHDGLSGFPVLKVLRETIGKAVATRDYGARYFKNNARPGLVLEVPATMSKEAVKNLRESWTAIHEGLENAHKVAILRDGVKLVPIDNTAETTQLVANIQLDAREIANLFGVPPHKVGDPSKAAYNSLESENESYLEDTLDRWLTVWEEETSDKLLTEEEKEQESHEIAFVRSRLSRAPLQQRGDYYSKAITGGWMCPDEARASEGLNPIPGGAGAVFVRPVNVQPADQKPAEPAPADPPPQEPTPEPDPAAAA